MKSNQDILLIAQAPNFRFKRIFNLIGEQFGNPFFITTDKHGNIFISDFLNYKIEMFDKNGKKYLNLLDVITIHLKNLRELHSILKVI
jgi:hypothetical protein